MNDTRAKLAELFRRLTDPTVSDLDALSDFVWFRKLRLDAGDVSQALGAGAPAAPNSAGTAASTPAAAPAPASEGPVMPFGKHKDVPIARLAVTQPDYLRWMLTKELREPLLGQIKAALAAKEAK